MTDRSPDEETPLDPRLAELVARLPRTAELPDGQWAAIQARLEPSETHGRAAAGSARRAGAASAMRRRWAGLAAAAVVLLAAGWWLAGRGGPAVGAWLAGRDDAATPTPVEPPRLGTESPRGTDDIAREDTSPKDSSPTIATTPDVALPDAAALDRALAARTDLDAATVAALRRNMAVIDSALADSRRALARNPGDRDVGALVRFAETQRRELLAQLQRLQPS